MDVEKPQRNRRILNYNLPAIAFVVISTAAAVLVVVESIDARRRETTLLTRINSLEARVSKLEAENVQTAFNYSNYDHSEFLQPPQQKRRAAKSSSTRVLAEMVNQTLREWCPPFNILCSYGKGKQIVPALLSHDAVIRLPLIRLADGLNEWEGRVEVYHNGAWGTVCDSHWSLKEADVVCRQLNKGYDKAVAVKRGAYFGPGSGKIWMDNVRCIGGESSLADCYFRNWGFHRCNHSQDASVICIGSIRLADGLRLQEGRVEVFHNGIWGTVCNNGWDMADGDVACRQLGYIRARSVSTSAYDGQGKEQIWMSNLGCRGGEQLLEKCPFPGWGNVEKNCSHKHDAGLSCIFDIRLRGGSKPEEGRVEVLFRGLWGTVCDDSWDMNDAHVACRQLGYVNAKDYKTPSYLGKGNTGKVWMANIHCLGNETRLDECLRDGRGWQNCSTERYAAVVCVANIRLSGGTAPGEGRVEVRHNGVWGTVCNRDWDLNDANVACRELGYFRALSLGARIESRFRISFGPVWMSHLSCVGSENRLSNCSFNGWGIHRCDHSDDVSMRCVTNIRLSGGDSSSGRVEVFENGLWKGICDEEWDLNNAHVACHQLGFYRATKYTTGNFFGQRIQEAWKTGLQCRGSEASLHDCTGAQSNCTSTNGSAGVICSSHVRLVGGTVSHEGNVEVLSQGIWGRVCDDSGEKLALARVVCQELGYHEAKNYTKYAYSSSSDTVWFYNIRCSGYEKSVLSCSLIERSRNYCRNTKFAAGVICSKPFVKLAGPLAPRIGRVEISYNGIWGTVCSRNWDLSAAKIVCRQLGFPDFGASFFLVRLSTAPVWMNDVKCKGFETHLSDCRFEGWGMSDCYFEELVGVACARRVRIIAGFTSNEGRVEVFYKGLWGTVCDNGWDITDGHVVCRELGFPFAVEVKKNSYFGDGVNRTWMSSVSCDGSESNLTDCKFSGWGKEECGLGRAAGVVCSTVRLTGGKSLNEGRVEVYRNKYWGAVCDSHWDFADAYVVCRQLGFPTVASVKRGVRKGTTDTVIDNLFCTGRETNIERCSFLVYWNMHNYCSFAGVVCATVRLAGNTAYSGRVEVYRGGVWGTVCDRGWDWTDGYVVCRELGFPTVVAVARESHFGHGSGRISMNDVACNGSESNLTDCSSGSLSEGSCNKNQRNAGVTCSRVRLTDGLTLNEGRVEVFYKGTWGSVCSDRWDFIDSHVVCREMGFPTASETQYYDSGRRTIWMNGVQCTGREQNLTRCRFYGWGVGSCFTKKTIGVVCATLRLSGSSMQNEGRVELYYKGTWGTVCDVGWDFSDAHVVCRELGFPTAVKAHKGAYFGQGSGKIWISSVDCSRSEANLTHCTFRGWGVIDCNPYESAAGVTCATLRLADGSASHEGRVEIYHNGEWGTVCDNRWDFTDARVVCSELGFPNALSVRKSSFFGGGFGPVWKSDIECTGRESNLSDCSFRGWGISDCSHSKDAGVICATLRLADGPNANEGRVEVYHRRRWSTICKKQWSLSDAEVVCRELGFPKAAAMTSGSYSYFGEGTGPIWLSGFGCRGNEENISLCTSKKWLINLNHSCSHKDDVGIICSTVRLVSGSTLNEGRVEVYYNGSWGTVCDSEWDNIDAHVVCKELGFPSASTVTPRSYFKAGSGPIWMNNVACEGKEANLTKCKVSGWGGHNNCNHSQDAAVICSTLRLAGGSSKNEGRVEVYREGVWGTVRGNFWNIINSHVVCRELGFPTGAVAAKYSAYFGKGDGVVWINVSCQGSEKNLTNCSYSGRDVSPYDHGNDTGVICSTVKLVGGSKPSEGRVEIYHSEEWGTVCDDNWEFTNAHVVCKEVGFYTAVEAKSKAHFGEGSGKIWMDNVACRGDETNLSQCRFKGWGINDCSHSEDASVVCLTVRLTGGGDGNEGRVEIYLDRSWVMVCDEEWDLKDAKVVCRELGFSTVSCVRRGSYFGRSSGSVWINEVACKGDESHLEHCDFGESGIKSCQSGEAGVTCTPVKLAGSSTSNAGRVEVYKGGTWGTVCDNGWDWKDANVVCKELGFSTAVTIDSFRQGSGPILMTNVDCQGFESSLTQCRVSDSRPRECPHRKVAGVECSIVRLVGGSSINEGRVEVYHRNTWGTVCHEGWD